MPVPGWTGAYDWAGTIPAAALPRRLDPPSGLLVNANNRLVDADYPFFLAADWEEPFRARTDRRELLAEGGPFDLDRMPAVQLDQVSGLARDFLPFLPAADAGPAGQRDVRAALAAWDGTMRVDRPEPLIFAAWQREFGLWLAGRALGADLAELGAGRPGFLRRALGGCRSRRGRLRRGRREHVRDRRGRARAALRQRLADLALGRRAPGRARPSAVRGRSRACATGSAGWCRSEATPPR